MNTKALLTTLFLLSSSTIFAEETAQIEQLTAAVEQLKAQVSSLQTNDDKQELRKLLAQVTAQIQHFHLESLKHNDKEIAAIQSDLKKQIDEIRADLAMSQKWENKAFAMLNQTLDNVQKQTSLTAQNEEPKLTSPQAKAEQKPELIGVTFYGSYIYWKPHLDGLEFAGNGFAQWPVNDKPPSHRGQLFRPNFHYSPGFRLGASYENSHNWGLNTMWTQLHSYAQRSVSCQPFGSVPGQHDMDLFGVWNATGGGFAAINSANARWHMQYNLLELTSSLSLHPAEHFTVRTSFGLMGASINQTYKIHYNSDSGMNDEWILIRNNFNGGGFRGILDLGWNANRHFDLFGRIGCGLALGKFRLLETQKSTYDRVLLHGKFLNIQDRFWSIKPEIDFSLGMQGTFPIFRGQQEIKVAFAWDFFLWLDQNQMMKFYGPDTYDFTTLYYYQPQRGHFNTQHGDLSMQGLTVTAGWKF